MSSDKLSSGFGQRMPANFASKLVVPSKQKLGSGLSQGSRSRISTQLHSMLGAAGMDDEFTTPLQKRQPTLPKPEASGKIVSAPVSKQSKLENGTGQRHRSSPPDLGALSPKQVLPGIGGKPLDLDQLIEDDDDPIQDEFKKQSYYVLSSKPVNNSGPLQTEVKAKKKRKRKKGQSNAIAAEHPPMPKQAPIIPSRADVDDPFLQMTTPFNLEEWTPVNTPRPPADFPISTNLVEPVAPLMQPVPTDEGAPVHLTEKDSLQVNTLKLAAKQAFGAEYKSARDHPTSAAPVKKKPSAAYARRLTTKTVENPVLSHWPSWKNRPENDSKRIPINPAQPNFKAVDQEPEIIQPAGHFYKPTPSYAVPPMPNRPGGDVRAGSVVITRISSFFSRFVSKFRRPRQQIGRNRSQFSAFS